VCRTLAWLGIGSDLYHTLRASLQLTLVVLSLALFRPLLSAHTLQVQTRMRATLLMHALGLTSTPAQTGALLQHEAAKTMRALGVTCLELAALPLWLCWHWHYRAHWLVDYTCFVALLSHWTALVATLFYLALGTRHRPAFFDTLLTWWDGKRQPRVAKKSKLGKKKL
jgi:hypothetical protein